MRSEIRNYLSEKRLQLLCWIYSNFPLQKKVVFQNFGGQGFGCNPKAIAIALHQLDPTVECVWVANSILKVKPAWLKVAMKYRHKIEELCTASVWVNNTRTGLRVPKRKGQLYIQTWHGAIGMKLCEGDVEDTLSPSYVATAKRDSKMTDIMLSSGRHTTAFMRRSFWYDGEILECGAPRCDYLIKHPHGTGVVHEFYGLANDIPLALYAPTFRDDARNAYDIDFPRLLATLRKRYGKDMKLVIRMHPNVQHIDFGFDYGPDYLNGSIYPDMYELMAECDVQINDFSTTMFEFSLTGKPVFLYANDLEKYAGERGLQFPIEELPFTFATTNDELMANIENFDDNNYKARVNDFLAGQGIVESGHASEDVARVILKHIYRYR